MSRRAQQRQAAEIRRLLGRLAEGWFILRNAEGCFRLVGEAETEATAVSRRVVEACLAAGLIEWQEERLLLTEPGRSRLRRSMAESDPFREQHQLKTIASREVGGEQRPVAVNQGESPLGWFRRRKDRNGRPLVGEAQYEAGERLRADYWFAHMSPRVTANWTTPAPAERSRRAAPSNSAALRDEVLAAKERVMRALMAVGPEISGILVDVCCELKGLEEAEKVNGWPQRAGKVMLQIALTRLAKHYGLIREARPGNWRLGIRHWGDADYRPRVDGEQEEGNPVDGHEA